MLCVFCKSVLGATVSKSHVWDGEVHDGLRATSILDAMEHFRGSGTPEHGYLRSGSLKFVVSANVAE